MPKIYEKMCPKSLTNAFTTFPKIWNRIMLGKFWEITRRFFYCIRYPKMIAG